MVKSIRKPYNDKLGYVCSKKISTGVYVVIYDNKNRQLGIDTGEDRWVAVYEPKGIMVTSSSLSKARACMKSLDWIN